MNIGKYEVAGKHKGCKYGGTVYRITDVKSGLDYFWCRGSYWDWIEKVHRRCKASTLSGDIVETEAQADILS